MLFRSDKKWENHSTKECYNLIRYFQGQAMQGVFIERKDGKGPILILNRQPPLPKTTPLRILGHEEDPNQEQAIVLITT